MPNNNGFIVIAGNTQTIKNGNKMHFVADTKESTRKEIYRSILHDLDVSGFVIDDSNRIIYLFGEELKMLGWDPEIVKGQNILDHIGRIPELSFDLHSAYGGRNTSRIFNLNHNQFEIKLRPAFDEHNKLLRITGVIHNITTSVPYKTQAEELHRRLGIISELSSDIIYSIRLKKRKHSRIEWLCGDIKKISGYTEAEINQMEDNWRTLVVASDRQNIEHVLMGKQKVLILNLEYRIITKSGDTKWIRDKAMAVRDETGKITRLVGNWQEKVIQGEDSRAINDSNFTSSVIRTSPVGIALLTTLGELTYINEKGMKILNLDQFIDHKKLIPVKDLNIHTFKKQLGLDITPVYSKIMNTGQSVYDAEFTLHTTDTVKNVSINASPLKNHEGEITSLILSIQDITQRKNYEQKLEAAVEEKDKLIRQIHHRVKNNLQLISSFIYLKKASFDSEELQLFAESMDGRIRAITQIHEHLLSGNNIEYVNMEPYLRRLVKDVKMISTSQTEVTDHFEVDDIQMKIEQAVLIGLITFELLSNAYAHAFKHVTTGQVWLKLKKTNSDSINFEIRDNGSGMDETIQLDDDSHFGLYMAGLFIKQLKANVEIERKKGTRYVITLQFK